MSEFNKTKYTYRELAQMKDRTAGQALRRLCQRGQHGHSNRHPVSMILLDGWSGWYHGDHDCVTLEEYERARALLARYKRFYNYVTEIAPQWREVDRRYYADNSRTVIEEDRHGNRRERMVSPPSGDACY